MNNAKFSVIILDICKVNKVLFFLSLCFHVFCCTEIIAFLATQNSSVNKVHVCMYVHSSFHVTSAVHI